MNLRSAALRMVRLGARSVGYSKEESALRAGRWVQSVLQPFGETTSSSLDLCMVIPTKSRGWILEAVCGEIGKYFQGRWEISSAMEDLPRAKSYFFCHYHFYLTALKLNPHLWDSRCVVWLTHPKDEGLGGPSAILALKRARVVTMCNLWRDYAIDLGLSADRVTAIVGAADPELFQPHSRGNGKIGFCTAYYERKGPHRILELVQAMPERDFILMGRNWNQYPDFHLLASLPNFEYREGAYQEYPMFYRELDVFVSLSDLEGGPIPLIESMMCNVVPVATKTGFAPDVIRHGHNGYLCDINASTELVSSLVKEAMTNQTAIRETVEHLSWRRFSELMQVELGLVTARKSYKFAG